MNSKLYDTLKWLVLTALPAISVFILAVGSKIGITNLDDVVAVLNAVTALLGAFIGVSGLHYQKQQDDLPKGE